MFSTILSLVLLFGHMPAGETQPECPVPNVSDFSNTWGGARSGGRRHRGTDLFADYNSIIVAPEAGVLEHGTSRLGGIVVRLYANTGRYYYMAHLAGYSASRTSGQQVEAGAIIGFVGNSGNARHTRPHLHIETSINGSRHNPYRWLRSCPSQPPAVVQLVPVVPEPPWGYIQRRS